MGPGGRDPMFPGARFRPVESFMQGAPANGLPPQAQGNAYGVPFIGLGNPANPAGQPAQQPAQAARMSLLQQMFRGGIQGSGPTANAGFVRRDR
jgi:hypothetical protein